MAFMKYATATVVQPHVSANVWSNIRTAGDVARSGGNLDKNLIVRASDLFEQDFKPSEYLLTHATIIASVDTFAPVGSKVGSQLVDGFQVNRKYPDFRITATTDKFINNNSDAWSRDVLMKSYQTFVGGHNFVEHIQVEELSRGRIIDAVSRDIGDSIYVDILIATDRKHTDLIQAIENGKMSTLSMGCSVDGTICSKCGHWAADETEMCPHIKYEKGNTFFDNQGRQSRVAELCGHGTIDPHGGVHFVEASWVEQPAFTGAVLRNVLEPTPITTAKVQEVLASVPPQWSETDYLKVAGFMPLVEEVLDTKVIDNVGQIRHDGALVGAIGKTQRAAIYGSADPFLAGWDDEGVEEGAEEGAEEVSDTPPTGEPAKSPLEDAEEDLEKHLMNRVVQRMKDKMKDKVVDDAIGGESSMAPNDTLIKEGSAGRMYKAALNTIVWKTASDADLVNSLAEYHQNIGIDIPVDIYRASLVVGYHKKYSSVDSFWDACCRVLGRVPNHYEAKTILRISKLLTQRKSLGCNSSHSGSRYKEDQ